VTCLRIHGDAVREAAIGDDRLAVSSIGVHRMDPAAAQFQDE
jgi:hypothetical protein